MNYLMGIDAGNTSIKTILFNELGQVVSESVSKSIRSTSRGKGFEEFDVDELWFSTKQCIKKSIEKSQIDPKDIISVGVTSFGNGLVVVDKDGNSIAPGAFSHDSRANDIIEMYKDDGVYEKINQIIKGTLFAGEPGPILRWFKKHEPETYAAIGGVLMFKDFITFKLTNHFTTDLNVFGGSGMADLIESAQSKELMALYGIEELYDKLPYMAKEPSEAIGEITPQAAEETGLTEKTTVVAGMMDILASLVGSGATESGVITSIAGTWCINETHSANIIPNASANMPYLQEGEYLNCSFTGASSANYEWFTKHLAGNAKIEASSRDVSYYKILDEHIAKIAPENATVLYHPFVAPPSVHTAAEANFFNINQNTSFSEIVYAVTEGIAFLHKKHIKFLTDSGLEARKVRLSGGLARSKVWVQIFANIVGLPVEVVDVEEVGALGVAIVAGIGAGLYKDYEDAFSKTLKILPAIKPDESVQKIYQERYEEWDYLITLMTEYWESKLKKAVVTHTL